GRLTLFVGLLSSFVAPLSSFVALLSLFACTRLRSLVGGLSTRHATAAEIETHHSRRSYCSQASSRGMRTRRIRHGARRRGLQNACPPDLRAQEREISAAWVLCRNGADRAVRFQRALRRRCSSATAIAPSHSADPGSGRRWTRRTASCGRPVSVG